MRLTVTLVDSDKLRPSVEFALRNAWLATKFALSESPGSLRHVPLTWLAAPHSYTTEDTVELSCHGGRVPLQETLRVVLAAGARHAEPGEFTLRAFLNGRLDLAQAEAVLDVISARTAEGWLSAAAAR